MLSDSIATGSPPLTLRQPHMFGKRKRRKLETARKEALSDIRGERLGFEAMVQRAQRAGDTPDDAFVADVLRRLAETEQRAINQATDIEPKHNLRHRSKDYPNPSSRSNVIRVQRARSRPLSSKFSASQMGRAKHNCPSDQIRASSRVCGFQRTSRSRGSLQ